MSTVKVYIRHGGYFEEETRYVGGDRVLVHLAMTQVTYANLLQEIRDQVGEESNFLLYYVSNADGGQDKVALRSDIDLLRLIVEQMKKTTIYVVSKDKEIARSTPTTQGSRIFTSVNIEEPSSEAPYSEEERSEEYDEERDEDEEVAEDIAEEAMDAADRTDLFESLTKEFGAWIREPRRLDRIVGHRNIHSVSQPTQDDDARADLEAIRDWLIPHVHLDTALPLGVLDPDYYTPVAGALREGGLFKRKLDVSVAVGHKYLSTLLKDLERALIESKATWKIVVGHHTIKSASDHGNTQELVDKLLPILEANGVDLYINGHDHCLQHISSSDSPLQFLTSGGGSKAWRGVYNWSNPKEMNFFYDGQGFMTLHINNYEVGLNFYDISGNILHKWSTPSRSTSAL